MEKINNQKLDALLEQLATKEQLAEAFVGLVQKYNNACDEVETLSSTPMYTTPPEVDELDVVEDSILPLLKKELSRVTTKLEETRAEKERLIDIEKRLTQSKKHIEDSLSCYDAQDDTKSKGYAVRKDRTEASYGKTENNQ